MPMSPSEMREQIRFEESLRPGSPVLAYWTNSGHYHVAEGTIDRVNRSSVRVRLNEPRNGLEFVTCPRLPWHLGKTRWSMTNRVTATAESRIPFGGSDGL